MVFIKELSSSQTRNIGGKCRGESIAFEDGEEADEEIWEGSKNPKVCKSIETIA